MTVSYQNGNDDNEPPFENWAENSPQRFHKTTVRATDQLCIVKITSSHVVVLSTFAFSPQISMNTRGGSLAFDMKMFLTEDCVAATKVCRAITS